MSILGFFAENLSCMSNDTLNGYAFMRGRKECLKPIQYCNPNVEASDLDAGFQRLKMASKRMVLYPKDRKRYLKALKKEFISKKDRVAEAIAKDFRGRAQMETYLADVFPVVSQIQYILNNLDEWMSIKPQETSWVYWPAKLEIRPQALGVVGAFHRGIILLRSVFFLYAMP